MTEALTDRTGVKDALASLCVRKVVTLEIQGPRYSMNDRLHVHAATRLKQDWRALGRFRAADAMQAGEWKLELAHLLVFQRPGDRRLTDPGNCAPAVKAAVDGMVDAGMFVDDDSVHLIGPDFRLGRVMKLPKKTWCLRFDVWVPDPQEEA